MDSRAEWASLLGTISRLYKYPFADQLTIHAQRPGATACASYEVWNNTMRRYVRRGAKGIALVDNSGDAPKLRYVFDIADTGTRRSSRPFSPWEINDGNVEAVSSALEDSFGAERGVSLASQLETAAALLADEYWMGNSRDILGIVDGSSLEEYDDFNIGVSFREAAAVSIAHTLLRRCGFEPENYLEPQDYEAVFEWDTPEAVTALGTAVSEISGIVLRQIERTVRREERSRTHGTELYDEGRNIAARAEPAGDGANRPLWEDAPELSAGAPANTVEPAPDERDAVAAPARDRNGGAEPHRPDTAEAGSESGRDGGAESSRPDEVDGPHEQLQGSGRRSSSERIDLQLNLFDEAEDAQAPSAFSFPQEVMDDVLRLGGNTDELRMRVVAEFETRRSIDEIAAFLPTVYRGGNGFTVDDDKYAVWYSEDGIRVAQGEQARYERGAQLIPWSDAAKRIGELLGDGRFATKEEVAGAEDYEHEFIARKLRDLQHDLSKGNEGLFPSLADVDGGYPEAVQKIAAKLADPEGREAVLGDYLAFREAYKADRSVLRFHYHDVDGIFVSLAAQLLERRKFTSDMESVPEVNSFITQDEIGDALSYGGGTAGSKWRIFKYFTEEHSLSEKATVLKDLYGIGGRSHALSGATGSGENHDAKGIRLEKRGCEDVNLTWSAVARRIGALIASDRYMTEAELAEYDLHTAAYAKYRGVKASNSDAIVLVAHGGSYYAYRPDAEEVSNALDLREQHAGGLDFVAFPGEQLDTALEKLRSRSAVSYVDEAGVEHTLPFIISVSDTEREQYEKQLVEALANDSTYVNAVRNSDRQNALDEGFAAIRRIAAASTDMRFLKLYHDNAEFRNGLRNDVLAAAYKEVSERPAVLQPREPTASAYGVGDFVWLDEREFKITDLQRDYVELLPPELPYPIYRTERRADFERMLRRDERNRHITDYLEQETAPSEVPVQPEEPVPPDEPDEAKPVVYIPVDGEWQGFPNVETAQDAVLEEFRKETRRRARNFRITDDHLGEGGAKAKCRAIIEAIRLLKYLEENGFQASSEQQEVLSDYVGWGGIPEVFDESKSEWSKEYAEQKALLTPEEYEAARGSTLNAHYTSPAVIKAIYEAVGSMGFEGGRILEPSMGVGNFFGLLPESMQGSKLYGVELDSITGRIAKQLYPEANITVAPIEGADLSEQLHKAVQNIHGEYTEREIEEAERSDILPADPDVRNYSFALVDGEVYYREGGIMVRQDVSAAMTARIKGLMELRDCTRKLIQLQTEDASDAEIAAEQQRLNQLYDAYTAKHGLISNRENKRAFSDDSSYYLLCSLEILDEDGKLERKADMFTRRTIQPHRPVEHTETAAEALAVSLNELGRVDMEYMSRLCGKSETEIAAELSGVIFRVPGTERYVTADEYLSGNVRDKLREAEAAAKDDASYSINVESLRAAQPRELTASEIDVRLGATWIEPRYIEQFMVETFQPTYWASRSMSVNYSPYTSE